MLTNGDLIDLAGDGARCEDSDDSEVLREVETVAGDDTAEANESPRPAPPELPLLPEPPPLPPPVQYPIPSLMVDAIPWVPEGPYSYGASDCAGAVPSDSSGN